MNSKTISRKEFEEFKQRIMKEIEKLKADIETLGYDLQRVEEVAEHGV